jgi:hypothetical protein
MEQRQGRVAPTRGSRVHRRIKGGRRLRAAAATGAVVVAAMPVLSADAVPTGGRSHEVFTQSNLIALNGYPANTEVRVEVVRRGEVLGFATKTSDAEGIIEMNHDGAAGGDCFESPTSPDVRAGDRIRTQILPGGATDTSVVRGVRINRVRFGVPNARSITVSGRVILGNGPAAVNRATDILELRINKDTNWAGTGRSDNRENINRSINRDGTWRHVMNGSRADVRQARASSEIFLEWSANTEAFPPELTVFDFGNPEPLAGCPPLQRDPTSPRMLAAHDTGRAGDHVTTKARNLTFRGRAGSGVSGGNNPATLLVNGTVVATDNDTAGGYEFTGVDLPARVRAYELRVESDGLTSPVRRVRVVPRSRA